MKICRFFWSCKVQFALLGSNAVVSSWYCHTIMVHHWPAENCSFFGTSYLCKDLFVLLFSTVWVPFFRTSWLITSRVYIVYRYDATMRQLDCYFLSVLFKREKRPSIILPNLTLVKEILLLWKSLPKTSLQKNY